MRRFIRMHGIPVYRMDYDNDLGMETMLLNVSKILSLGVEHELISDVQSSKNKPFLIPQNAISVVDLLKHKIEMNNQQFLDTLILAVDSPIKSKHYSPIENFNLVSKLFKYVLFSKKVIVEFHNACPSYLFEGNKDYEE